MTSSHEDLVFRSGTYQGECLYDCNEEISVDADSIHYSLTGNAPDPAREVHEKASTPSSAWEGLTARFDWEALRKLPDRIGQPDAYDQGGEWIEVRRGDEVKRIDLETDAELPAIQPLLDELRRLRGEAAKRHRADR